jgi:hypothetical protein
MTNRLAMLVVGAIAVLLLAGPAGAYLLTLRDWNEAALEAAGDTVTVNVSGSTITFTWNDGNGLPPAATRLDTLFWTTAVATAGGNSGSPTSSNPAGYTYRNASGSDGFNNSNGYPGGYAREADSPNNVSATAVTFTFANSLPTSFTANDFVAHVVYGSGCSGFVGGPGTGGSGPPFNSPGNAGCAATTPVPEPITMFLGGTGLLALGYAARKRLFGGQLASAS